MAETSTKPKPQELLEQIAVLVGTSFAPQQHVIHKPTLKGTGQALKIQLRLHPKWVEGKDGGAGFFDRKANKEGGLFLEIAPQGPKDENGYPTFLWRDADKILRAKLGIPDITGLLVAIREYRHLNRNVPPYLQGKNGQANAVSLFHKFEKGSTIITYTFDEYQSILRISKGKDLARSISLSLSEEKILEHMLEMALDAFLRVGKR